MKDLGQFEQYDLLEPDDCLDLVAYYGFTNSQIKEMRAKGVRYASQNKELKNA